MPSRQELSKICLMALIEHLIWLKDFIDVNILSKFIQILFYTPFARFWYHSSADKNHSVYNSQSQSQ